MDFTKLEVGFLGEFSKVGFWKTLEIFEFYLFQSSGNLLQTLKFENIDRK